MYYWQRDQRAVKLKRRYMLRTQFVYYRNALRISAEKKRFTFECFVNRTESSFAKCHLLKCKWRSLVSFGVCMYIYLFLYTAGRCDRVLFCFWFMEWSHSQLTTAFAGGDFEYEIIQLEYTKYRERMQLWFKCA